MSYINPDSEDAAIEQPTIALFAELGWETLNCYHENFRAALPAWPGNDGRSRPAESPSSRHRKAESRRIAKRHRHRHPGIDQRPQYPESRSGRIKPCTSF